MDRRSFLGAMAGALLVRPFTSEAQQPGKIRRIGMLERTSATINAANVAAFRRGLGALGYLEGRNVIVEYRSAEGHDDRYAALAAALVQANVDLIVSRGTPAALAVKEATRTIPAVVLGVGDPVGQGIVASLARPGANITGLSASVTELFPKRVQLLKELAPRATRIAGLFNLSNPALPPQWKAVETAARAARLEPHLLDVRERGDLAPAFDAATRQRADALVVALDTLTQANQGTIVSLAAKHRLPAIYASAEFGGGLVAYGVDYPEMYRRVARFAHKIFNGASPADIPVEEPTKFELVINLKAAKALGLTIPESLLLRADQVIEDSPQLQGA